MRKYRPNELFDKEGRLLADLATPAPAGDRGMDANPHVNSGRVLKALDLPDFAQYALSTPGPGEAVAEAPRKLRELLGGWPSQHRTVPGAPRARKGA